MLTWKDFCSGVTLLMKEPHVLPWHAFHPCFDSLLIPMLVEVEITFKFIIL